MKKSIADRQLDEIRKLYDKSEPDVSVEDKTEFLDKQIESLSNQMYRFAVDAEIAKEYIDYGETMEEESFVKTGERKLEETVQAARPTRLALKRARELREELEGEE